LEVLKCKDQERIPAFTLLLPPHNTNKVFPIAFIDDHERTEPAQHGVSSMQN